MRKLYKINLCYLKESGKYYTDASFYTQKEYMHQVFDEVRDMNLHKKLPGLTSGSWSDFIYVSSDEHPNAYPGLIVKKP